MSCGKFAFFAVVFVALFYQTSALTKAQKKAAKAFYELCLAGVGAVAVNPATVDEIFNDIYQSNEGVRSGVGEFSLEMFKCLLLKLIEVAKTKITNGPAVGNPQELTLDEWYALLEPKNSVVVLRELSAATKFGSRANPLTFLQLLHKYIYGLVNNDGENEFSTFAELRTFYIDKLSIKQAVVDKCYGEVKRGIEFYIQDLVAYFTKKGALFSKAIYLELSE